MTSEAPETVPLVEPENTPEAALNPDAGNSPVATANPTANPTAKPNTKPSVQPVLEKLFELYPHLFGAEFLPLKLGVFQDLLAAHPDVFQRDSLKLALGLHTRSGRYLQSVAAGHKRHDLQGQAVEDVAPEHIYFALVELFRRRQRRTAEDLRPKLRKQLIAAFESSNLTYQAYLGRVQTKDLEANAWLEDALAAHGQAAAKAEALRSAFEASGKTLEEFADMYGLSVVDVRGLKAALSHASSPAADPA